MKKLWGYGVGIWLVLSLIFYKEDSDQIKETYKTIQENAEHIGKLEEFIRLPRPDVTKSFDYCHDGRVFVVFVAGPLMDVIMKPDQPEEPCWPAPKESDKKINALIKERQQWKL